MSKLSIGQMHSVGDGAQFGGSGPRFAGGKTEVFGQTEGEKKECGEAIGGGKFEEGNENGN